MPKTKKTDALPTTGPRVLFVGNLKGPSTSAHYFVALLRLGCAVYPYDFDCLETRTLSERWALRLTKRPSAARMEKAHRDIVDLVRTNSFDIVFIMSQNFFAKELLEQIRQESKMAPLIIYHSHDNNFSPGILKSADFFETITAYDFVFTTKSHSVACYEALGQPQSFYLPSAFEPTIHHPIPQGYSRHSGSPFELTFVGTYDYSRDAMVEVLGWKHLRVWGDRWERYRGFQEHRNEIHPSAIYHFEYADVLSHSKCALGLLREEAEDLHTQRTFEIPACGTLQIAPRNDEILGFFKEGKEIVCFSGTEELKEKSLYYLAHESERKAIAARGYERCLRDGHTYQDRVSEILATVLSSRNELKKAG